jgi:hypothetical protein
VKVEIHIDEAYQGRDDLIGIVKTAANFLAARDTDLDSQAEAVWELWPGPAGQPLIGLHLRDQDVEQKHVFGARLLTPEGDGELRLVQIWNDVLHQRTLRQFRRVNELISQLED